MMLGGRGDIMWRGLDNAGQRWGYIVESVNIKVGAPKDSVGCPAGVFGGTASGRALGNVGGQAQGGPGLKLCKGP